MRFFPLGDSALTVEFGDGISLESNLRAIALNDALSAKPFAGMIEAVPAYSSLTVFYDPVAVRRNASQFTNAFEAVKDHVQNSVDRLGDTPRHKPRTVEIAVSFDDADALDLADAAASVGLSAEEFIEIFLSRTYRVFMLGFLPGFAYMGEVDERITVPRKATPRLRVPKGSVGIAGAQTGIYPLESPGGWQIIGRTYAEMFSPVSEKPTLLNAGDIVQFIRK
ncbi:MAG: 5-oxoprolinase subunit PxpB [Pyrinomonadaceae bacterium]|nr:5-oxoprolinase subunit PxpB [Pyrinomonadaceae bacterium]